MGPLISLPLLFPFVGKGREAPLSLQETMFQLKYGVGQFNKVPYSKPI